MEYIYFGFVATHASVYNPPPPKKRKKKKKEKDKFSQFKKIKVQRRTIRKTTVLKDTYVL